MNFLKIAEGVYVNTANILQFEVTQNSVNIHMVGRSTPVALVKDDPVAAALWVEWITTHTVNVMVGKKA